MLAVPDRQPTTLADRLAIPNERILEPRDDQTRLWPGMSLGYVVVGESGIKWVLHRSETRSLAGIIAAAVVANPLQIPGALRIRNWIPRGRLLSDPEHRRRNVIFPGISPCPGFGAGNNR